MQLLDLETSLQEVKKLNIASYLVLPINAKLDKFKKKIERKIKFPCWIKINSGEHKSELQGVEKCYNYEELKKVHDNFKKRFRGKKFVVQKDVKGKEIIAGIKQDSTFGKILLIGSGGKLAEIIKDIEFRVIPLEKKEIKLALMDLKIYSIIKNLNLRKLINQIYKFSKLDLKEADLNPIKINEKDAVIVDARVRI